MGERDVEAVEDIEDVAEVGDGEHVGVEVQRALEAGRGHRVDARAEPGILDDGDAGEHAGLERPHRSRGRSAGRARPGRPIGGAAGERPVAGAGRDEEDAVTQDASPARRGRRDLSGATIGGKGARLGKVPSRIKALI